jgi:hypothetical protein
MALTTRQAQRKTWLESALTAIQNAQLGILTAGTTEVSFNGRSVTNLAPQEMERLRRSYEAELQKLERIERGVSSRTIRVIG